MTALELLKNLTQDYSNCSGEEIEVGEFAAVNGNGVLAHMKTADGNEYRITVERV